MKERSNLGTKEGTHAILTVEVTTDDIKAGRKFNTLVIGLSTGDTKRKENIEK